MISSLPPGRVKVTVWVLLCTPADYHGVDVVNAHQMQSTRRVKLVGAQLIGHVRRTTGRKLPRQVDSR